MLLARPHCHQPRLGADSLPGREVISMRGRYHEESCLHATGSRCVSLINVAERTLQLFFFPLNGRHVEPESLALLLRLAMTPLTTLSR